ILIGAETRHHIGDAFVTREIDSIAVYGRVEGLTVYELIGLSADTREFAGWIKAYEQGLAKYRQRDFAGASSDFEAVLRECPDDRAAALLLERCNHLLRSGVVEDWRPIAALKTK